MSTTADEALYAVLNAHAGLAALIGTGTAMRCYPVEAPPTATLPLLVYQVINVDPRTTLGQGTGDDSRLDGVRFQLTALADRPITAAQVIKQAGDAIEASTTLRGILIDERSLGRAEQANAHGRAADFLIWNNPDT